MAKQRIVNTKFWDDSYIAGLAPLEKLLFLYLITNPLTNISGVYELPLKRAAFDVGSPIVDVERILRKFEMDGRIRRLGGWVGVVNFIKHQALNPKIRTGILKELKSAPKELVDSLSIDYQALSVGLDGPSHLNSNSNSNPNLNSNSETAGRLSMERAEAIRRGTAKVADTFRLRG